MLLNLDLQMFAEGEDDSLDIDSLLEEFESEWTDEPEEETEQSQEKSQEDELENQEQQTDKPEQESTPDPNDADAEKRNRAFADLRRQAEENRKYAEFIQKLATESGITPDQLLARYSERQLEQEAERQQVPVELLKRQQDTETELSQLKERMRAERFDVQVNSVVQKYGANDESIRETFNYMLQSGIDPRVADNVDFERFYRAANLDSIIQKEIANTRQQDLEDKKKRQQNASIANGQSVSPPSETDWSDEDFDAQLEKLGLRL